VVARKFSSSNRLNPRSADSRQQRYKSDNKRCLDSARHDKECTLGMETLYPQEPDQRSVPGLSRASAAIRFSV
jgi:hypothetical protein